ncbi:hypothetical protein MVEN_02607300 [Mycena venus]|uniref:F-box domain-containing protein n=1 Tax=Mycena venus TaxID=2733690 RepID=A0A8H6U160_9AGAR|nr:hypothetical protein MVEN_02607300 [Mycena venus]
MAREVVMRIIPSVSLTMHTLIFANAVSLTSMLPEDILVLLLFCVLGSFSDDPRGYDVSRRRLRQIDRRWMCVVDRYPLAWKNVYVSFATYPRSFRLSIMKSNLLNIDVVIDLTDTYFTARNHWTKTEIQNYVDVLFTILDDSWLLFDTLPPFALHSLILQLDFNFSAPVYRQSALFDDTGVTRVLDVPAIRYLDMDGLIPDWVIVSPYSSLTRLAFRKVAVTPTSLSTVLRATPQLLVLELRDVEFNVRNHQFIQPLPALPNVHHLVLETSRHTIHSVSSSVSSKLVLPALRSLELICRRCPAMCYHSSTEAAYLRSVESLTICMNMEGHMGFPSDEQTSTFLCALPSQGLPFRSVVFPLCPDLQNLVFVGEVGTRVIDKLLLERPSWMFHAVLSIISSERKERYRVIEGQVLVEHCQLRIV